MLLPGQILQNRYRIERQLAMGGAGAVYLAIDTSLNRNVVLRSFELGGLPANDKEPFISRIMIGISPLARLSHPSLARIVDYFVADNRPYVVIEHVPGVTLDDAARDMHSVPEGVLIDWGLQICNALQYLHSQDPPIFLRDLNPRSIRIEPDGRLKLIDLDWLFIRDDIVNFGLQGYSAPELYGNGKIGPYSDVYSLGVTLWHLATGLEPDNALSQPLPGAERLNPRISKSFADVIEKATQPDGAKRYQTAFQFGLALTAITPPLAPPPMGIPKAQSPSAPSPPPPGRGANELYEYDRHKYCPQCGHEVRLTAKYCPNCGGRLDINPQAGQARPATGSLPRGSSLISEKVALDIATPKQVTVNRSFEIAAAVRQLSSKTKINDSSLRNFASAVGQVFRKKDQKVVRYRVVVSAPECEVIFGEYVFLLKPKTDAEPCFFQLIPKRTGTISILVNAYQDDSLHVANTRTQIMAVLEVVEYETRGQLADVLGTRRLLFDILVEYFNVSDLQSELCFALRIDWDGLSGDNKTRKAQALIEYCEHRGRTQDLIDTIKRVRPQVVVDPFLK